jgi:hypothetical protein
MDALTLLRNSGWYPGRSVDSSVDVGALKAEGFEVTEVAERFLREFSHLSISWETQSSPLIIDGAVVARNADTGWCELYSEAIATVLVPVGEYSHMTLYIDLEGGLWGGFDGEYGHRGSLLDVIQSIFLEPPRGFDRRIELD